LTSLLCGFGATGGFAFFGVSGGGCGSGSLNKAAPVFGISGGGCGSGSLDKAAPGTEYKLGSSCGERQQVVILHGAEISSL
jgi:hypothetical protein